MEQTQLIIMALVLAVVAPYCASAADKQNDHDDGGIARSSPLQVGDVDAAFWGPQTPAQQAAAVDSLRTFADKASDQIKHPLHPQESKYFLLYSDLNQINAGRNLDLLERMYAKLAELFPADNKPNVWRGKALVFIFTRIEDYRLYERLAEGNDPGGSYGMTHCFGDGMVHMAFYRYPDDIQFGHLLVHESVHGFLHRYRTPARVPSWANEGLADELAGEVIVNPRRTKFIAQLVRAGLAQHNNGLGDFFTARHIDGWQYPIAETLTAWLIHHNRKGYLDFINGIKDGQAWDESLKANLKLSRDSMISEYGKWVGVRSLKPS